MIPMLKEAASAVLLWVVIAATFATTMFLGQWIVDIGVKIVLSLQNIIS